MPGIQLLSIYRLTGSPRWLIAKKQHSRAKKMLAQYHGDSKKTDFVNWEFAEIVQTPGNQKRCMLIILPAILLERSGNGLVSYYLAQVLKTIAFANASDQALINDGLTIWCWLVSLGCAFLVDRVGRRILFLGAGVGMLIAFSIWTAYSAVYAQTGNLTAGAAVLAMVFLFYGAAGLAWPGLTVSYTVETLPFNIRTKALILSFVFLSLSTVFN